MTDLQVLAVKNSFTPNFSPLDFAMEINGFHVLCILLEFIWKFWTNTVILLSFDIKLSEFIWKYVPLSGCLKFSLI